MRIGTQLTLFTYLHLAASDIARAVKEGAALRAANKTPRWEWR